MNPYQPPAQYPVPPQDPQSKYPQLPPVNNHHQNIPPQQYPQYPQYPPQGNHNNQQGYAPPNQYALIGANPVIPDSRTLMKNKIKDVEKLIEKDFFWYRLWLNLMIVLGGFTAGFAGVFFGFTLIDDGTDAFTSNYFSIFAVIGGIWLVMQGLSQIQVFVKKDLVKAKKAFASICWFAFFYLLFIVKILVDAQSYKEYYSSFLQQSYWMFIVGYVIPMWIHIAGARKVKNLLEKRDALALELDTRYANNL